MLQAEAVNWWMFRPMRSSGVLAARVRDASIASIFLLINLETNASDTSGTTRILTQIYEGRRFR